MIQIFPEASSEFFFAGRVIMKLTATISITGMALVLLAGCQTTPRQLEAETRREEWEDSWSRRLSSIETRLFELENSIARQHREQREIDRRVANLSSAVGTAQREEIEALRKELAAARGETERKIAAILEEVARENERILQAIRAARGTAAYAQGYEHVVRSGETVSTIAREYGTTVSAIVEANQLTDPNAIRVGQILFVPE